MSKHTTERDYWDSVGEHWRAIQPDRLWRRYSDRHQLNLLTRWLPTMGGAERLPGSQRLLKTDLFDEVAGMGLVGPLQRLGYHVTGIDISSVVVEQARGWNPELEARVADVRALDFPDACFDVVYSGSTLDHFGSVAEIQQSLEELARVLRPGGGLILTLDNPSNPLIWLRNGRLQSVLDRFGIIPYRMGATLDRVSLPTALSAAGLRCVEQTALLHSPRVMAVALGRLLSRGGPRLEEWYLNGLACWESLEILPTRFATGYYLAVVAVKG